MSEIKWEDPKYLAPGRSETDYSEIARQLRANPGKWAVVAGIGNVGTTTRIKRGALKDFRPAGTFEAVSNAIKGEPQHRRKVYARYIGEESK